MISSKKINLKKGRKIMIKNKFYGKNVLRTQYNFVDLYFDFSGEDKKFQKLEEGKEIETKETTPKIKGVKLIEPARNIGLTACELIKKNQHLLTRENLVDALRAVYKGKRSTWGSCAVVASDVLNPKYVTGGADCRYKDSVLCKKDANGYYYI
jgi:hypothetical protein